MKKLIKDEIYHSPFYLVVCEKEKYPEVIKRHYKKIGFEYNDETDNPFVSFHEKTTADGVDTHWIWIEEKTFKSSWKSTILSVTHELNHFVDDIFDLIGMQQSNNSRDITEARAYYYEYLLRQVLKYLYK